MRRSRFKLKPCTLIAASVSLIFAQAAALANPTGPQVVNGAVSFQQPNVSTLNVTNSPGSIINWQGFSIGSSEVTRFIQQSASSAVLNRVVGSNLSQIYGQLLSNGRVFLINPGGIVVGPGAIVDTAGFVASTLNMLDADFIAGRLKFQGDASSGSIVNQGWIRTGYGGQVVLVAPTIENSGLIHTPGGELILAAGQKLTISSLDLEGVQFEVQAPTDTVVNVGKLLADGGAVGVFAGTLRHSGEIRANALVYDEAGRIVLKAQNEIQLGAGSATATDGKTGGTVTVESTGGLTRVAGNVTATGSAGPGGTIELLGNRVAVVDNALVDASGSTRGGRILVGGDYQGGNPAIQNSTNTFVGSATTLRADATQNGDGGRTIVWSDDKAQFYGSLSAQGGPEGGNGGFAEVSGKQGLVFAGGANLGAPKGKLGDLLLDPLDQYVFTGGGLDPTIINESTDFPSNAATVDPVTLAAIVGNVTLFASRYMRISSPIDLTATSGATPTATPNKGLTVQVGTWTKPASPDPLNLSNSDPSSTDAQINTVLNQLDIGANITTANGAVSLTAPKIQTFANSTIATAGGAVTLSAAGPIQASSLSIDAGSGAVTATAGTDAAAISKFLQLGAVTGGSFTASAPDSIQLFGAITTGGGAVTINSSGSTFTTSSTIDTRTGGTGPTGGAVSITAPSSVTTRSILAGSGNITLAGSNLSNNGNTPLLNTLDTTGTVSLNATAGSISSFRINNSSGVTATATNAQGSAIVNLFSDTVLNANTVTATTTFCSTFGSCSSANIDVRGDLGVNVGTVTATAPTNFTILASPSFGATYADERFEGINSSVIVFSNAGPIRAQSASSLITANNVTLGTTPFSATGGGGGIGTNATPLRVDVKSKFDFSPNGDFNTQLIGTGAGPNDLRMQIGVAPTGQTYSGTLTKTGLFSLNVSSADNTTVTAALDISSGFDTRIFNTPPLVRLSVPNGNLVATTVNVPKGDQTGILSPQARRNCDVFGGTSCPPQPTIEPLSVLLSASKDLQVDNYTRASGGIAKQTTFQAGSAFSATPGSVTLGTIAASKDIVSVTAGVNASITNLTSGSGSISTTQGNVTVSNWSSSGSASVTSSQGNVTIGLIDTTGGTGLVTLTAQSGAVQAQTDSGAVEVTSGDSINVTATTIGASTFANPLDLAGSSIALTSQSSGGKIGFAGAPVIANTQNLTITAASPSAFNVANGVPFNVSTGATALKTLTVLANPGGVGSGGLAQVRTEAGGANDRTYSFVSNGTDFTFNPGTVPATQFAGGTFSFTANDGNITLGNANLGTGALSISALDGSIVAAGSTIDGASLTLAAGTGVGSATPVSITTGNIGSIVRPNNLTITSGLVTFGTDRSGSVTTGTVEAGSLGITAYNGNIVVGNVGTTTAAGAISVTGNRNDFGGPGTIQVGNVAANSIALSTDNAITGGNLNAASIITLSSLTSVTTGTLDAPSIVIGQTPCLCFSPPATTVMGAIGGIQPATTVSIDGSTVTVAGTVTGNPAAADTINIQAFTGTLSINGGNTVVTGGDGSTITLRSEGVGALAFSNVNAGATGTVSIRTDSGTGIRQVGASGITAKTVSLSATSAGADIDGDPASPTSGSLQLNNTKILTVNVNTGGTVALNANGSQFDSISITTSSGPDTGPISLSNMGGSQTLTVSDLGNSDFNLALSSPGSPLIFTFNANATGIRTAGSGIATGGGNLRLTAAGSFDGTTGGITTNGGAVNISANAGLAATGSINSTGPTSTGGAIQVSASGNIDVNGPLTSGPGTINLQAGNSITRSGALSTVTSGTSVTARAGDGDIGNSVTPLLVTAPTANLTGDQFVATAGAGHVFATLTGTNDLTLLGDNGFNVSSDTAFSTLRVTTRGSGTGTPGSSTLNLAAPNQSYSFARPGTDLFSTAITNTFQVVSVGGTSPPTNATFAVSDGDLLVGGPGTIAATSLTLTAQSGTSDLKLQGTAANPLNLSHTTQDFSAGRDLLVRGNVALSAGTTQSLFASRNLTAQAEGGTLAFSAANQNISTSSGSISFLGGTLANETVSVSATGSQTVSTNIFGAGSVLLQGGSGPGSSVTVSHAGTGNQSVTAGGNITVQAGPGPGANSIAAITNAAGSQYVASNTDVNVRGGDGTDAIARITNTSTSDQTVGESRSFTSFQTNNIEVKGGAGSGAFAEIVAAGPQQIYSQFGTLNVEGGAGTNANARIESTSTSEQQIGFPDYFCCGSAIGSVIIKGGPGPGTGSYAHIDANGLQRVTANSSIALTGTTTDAHAILSGATQDIRRGNITLTAGAGNNANALIASDTSQFIDPGNVTLIGGGSASTTATAKITAAGLQQIFGSAMSLTSGVGANSVAQITTTGDQTINFSSLALSAVNGGNGSFAKIDAVTAGTTQSLSGGNLTMTAGGAGQTVEPFVAVPNASAIIEGHSQTIFSGATTLNGGAGASGSTSDAIVRNLSGSQSVFASSITLNGGHTQSTTAILNLGTGTQTVSGSSGILVRSDPNLPPAHADSFVLIQNTPATDQFITGALSLTNSGAGTVAVTTGGDQLIKARFVDVQTAAGSSGDASLAATGNQWIHTTLGSLSGDSAAGPVTGISLRVAAKGTGTASVTAGASQLLELDYPEQFTQGSTGGTLMVGDTAAAGTSRVKAADQNIFARSIVIQGPAGSEKTSELKATGTQTITTLLGGIEVLGGSGNYAVRGNPPSAQIDPVTQTLLVNGQVEVVGGSGVNAVAQILNGSGTQTIIATNGDIILTGGSAPGADALITSLGTQTISTTGTIVPTSVPLGGNAFISPLGNPPATCGTPCVLTTVATGGTSVVAGTATTTVLTTEEALEQTLLEITPEGVVTEPTAVRRAPVCR